MATLFLRGFLLRGTFLAAALGAFTTDWISSELMSLDRSALDMTFSGRTNLPDPAAYSSSSLAMDPFVQMHSLPRWPPGARSRRLSLSTLQASTPGRFLTDLAKP